MKNWMDDPREWLPMHLKLRRGLRFNSVCDQIEASLPGVLEATILQQWQYRIMLSLTGEQALIDVVREVKEKFPHHFEAADVWRFLDWLVDKELVCPWVPEEEAAACIAETVYENEAIGQKKWSPWLRIPMQLFAVAVMSLSVATLTYFSTPVILAVFQGEAELEHDGGFATVVEESRYPNASIPEEKEVAAIADEPEEKSLPPELEVEMVEPIEIEMPEGTMETIPKDEEGQEPVPAPEQEEKTELPEGNAVKTVADRLTELRQAVAACQIRRDECYLLNDEDGYRKEVEKISELVREIALIRVSLGGDGL